ncbi:hypothetical protein Q3G72_034859 [Acer saccharum]|nr:hypothetical protein Q3G72_034859 [Acer saccharum]
MWMSGGLVANDGKDEVEDEKVIDKLSFVLTTPLYYVNALPHMGSAYTTIAADAIARLQMSMERRLLRLPLPVALVLVSIVMSLWKDLDIAYDKFIRTTDPKHEAIVKEFYSRTVNRCFNESSQNPGTSHTAITANNFKVNWVYFTAQSSGTYAVLEPILLSSCQRKTVPLMRSC